MEIVLVVGIIILIVGSVGIVQGSILADSYLDSKSNEVIQGLRLHQVRSITNFKNSKWGVRIDTSTNPDQFVLFKGNSYASRDSSFDIEIDLPDLLSVSNINLNGGSSEVVFDSFTGKTDDYGSFVIADNDGNSTTISINSFGVIDTN